VTKEKDQSMRIARITATAALALMLTVGAQVASASSVAVQNTAVVFTALPGETNHVTYWSGAPETVATQHFDVIVVHDPEIDPPAATELPAAVWQTVPISGCRAVGSDRWCRAQVLNSVTANLGDLNDSIAPVAPFVDGPLAAHGEAGNDQLTGTNYENPDGDFADALTGGPGDDTINPGDGNDFISSLDDGNDVIHARDGFHDFVWCGNGVETVYVDSLDELSGTGTTGGCDNVFAG